MTKLFASVYTPEHLPSPYGTLFDCPVPTIENVFFTVCGIAKHVDGFLARKTPSIDGDGAKCLNMARVVFARNSSTAFPAIH